MRVVLLVALLVLCEAGLAREFFVSPDGRREATGAQDDPMRTLTDALAKAGAGDRVVLSAGVYRETGMRVRRSGAADRPLVIEAAPNATVVISGSALVRGWVQVEPGLWHRPAWPIDSQQLFVDGTPLTLVNARNAFTTMDTGDGNVCLPPRGDARSKLRPGQFRYDAGARILQCALEAGVDPNLIETEASVGGDLLVGGTSDHVVLRGITFRHGNGTAQGQRTALVRVDGNHWLIENCAFVNGDFAGLALAGEGHVVRDCRFIDNGCVGIDVNGSDARHRHERFDDRPSQQIVLESLTITGNNRKGFYEYWHSGGMKLVPGVRGATVRDCRILDNNGPGVWFDAPLGGNVIRDNLIARNSVGVSIEIGYPGDNETTTAVIENNRICQNRHQGVYVSASQGVRVIGNTIIGNNWDVVLHGMPRAGAKLSGNVVRNNILAGRLADWVCFRGDDAEDNLLDSNLFARPADEVRIGLVTDRGYDIAYRSLRAVRREFPAVEANGVVHDVAWRDVDTLDLRHDLPAPLSKFGWQPTTRE